MKSLYGLGNPLLDVIVRAEPEALVALGAAPGSMNLVDHHQQSAALQSGREARRLPGGSCANTVRGVQFLARQWGGELNVLYSGGVGRDQIGSDFARLLTVEGVKPRMAVSDTPTGSSVILVTPDGQRTMFTFLGACRELGPGDVDREELGRTGVFHTTGYMWDTPNQEQAAREAAAQARRDGALISFDVADCFVVDRYRESLLGWIPGNVDLLFANREELVSLTTSDGDCEALIRAGGELAPTVVMKTGRDGCTVLHDGTITNHAAAPAHRYDTTAAGDAFAAGYLYGLLSGRSHPDSAVVANRLAGAIVTVEGCDFQAVASSELLRTPPQ